MIDLGDSTAYVLLNWTDHRDVKRFLQPGPFSVRTTNAGSRDVRDSYDVEIPARSGVIVTIWPGLHLTGAVH